MGNYGYVLYQTEEKKEKTRYHRSSLELMTTYQLGEICRRESLAQGIMDPLDKEELIRIILRFRGADEYFLIRRESSEGRAALSAAWRTMKLTEQTDIPIACSSRLTVYEGLAVTFWDHLTLPYDRRLAGTNAFVTDSGGNICAILNVEARGEDTEALYLTRTAELKAAESDLKIYNLYCMGQHSSELLYRIYMGDGPALPERLPVYRVPLLDFEVRKPVTLAMPLAIDFGTANTTAGVYLDSRYFELTKGAGRQEGPGLGTGLQKNDVNYVKFHDVTMEWQETPLFPTAVSVLSAGEEGNQLLFGYEAIRLAGSSYVDEGFCVFYDIKRWISDYERVEEITDREGRRDFLKRKEVLREYFRHIIHAAADQFKCKINSLHISCPVKQKEQFLKLFREILPGYTIQGEGILDEGAAVLYSTITGMVNSGKVRLGEEYKALILDCGGGTTDLNTCTFCVRERRASYRIDIRTAYENGNTNFGGNNLTFRIMQLLKLSIARALGCQVCGTAGEILMGMNVDVYRYVDEYGKEALYSQLETEYAKAEQFLPTRFREYEQRSRAEYFMVKNNFYYLFQLAETVKKEFHGRFGMVRAVLASDSVKEAHTRWIPADKWKLSAYKKGKLETVRDFPSIYLESYEIELLLKADIYDIVRQFMAKMYEEEKVEEYAIIKLTGQSCQIETFRDALKEFVPGRTIQFHQRSGETRQRNELKMACLDGALWYLKDRQYGFADVAVLNEEPALPYQITAYTHSGAEEVLIHRLRLRARSGIISRNMENLTLELYLKDDTGEEKYRYLSYSHMKDFRLVEYREIQAVYGEHIPQADTDDIEEREVRFFVWSLPEEWAFMVVPVCRREERLHLGKKEVFHYENENWVLNFFDGMK